MKKKEKKMFIKDLILINKINYKINNYKIKK